VLQRRIAEIDQHRTAQREQLETMISEAVEEPSGGRRGGLLGRNGGNGKSLETLHAALRDKEVELQAQERRLSELSSALQRREADLESYARKLQQTGSAPAREDGDGGERPAREEGSREQRPRDEDPTARRLQFWSR
jgi:hypothetical protein